MNTIVDFLTKQQPGMSLFFLGMLIIGCARQYSISVKEQKKYPLTELQYLVLFLTLPFRKNIDSVVFPENVQKRLGRIKPVLIVGMLIALGGAVIHFFY